MISYNSPVPYLILTMIW